MSSTLQSDLPAGHPFGDWTDADFAAYERLMPSYLGHRDQLVSDLIEDYVSVRDLEDAAACEREAAAVPYQPIDWTDVPY